MSCTPACVCLCQQSGCGCHEGPPPKPRPKDLGTAYAKAHPITLTPEQVDSAARILVSL